MLGRRDFIKLALLAPLALKVDAKVSLQKETPPLHEALYYEKVDEKKKVVGCLLCPRACSIQDGETGFCRARKNIRGKLYSLGYAQPCAIHVDPVEKKPFFNVLPRTLSLSLACAGCNLRCKFCQNWQISQISPMESNNYHLSPGKLVEAAKSSGCKSIAYTYTEPTNFYEYMLDTAVIARSQGILNVQHSNGYINPAPLKELCKYLDAANIDLKGFSTAFYNKMCEAELEPVLETIKTMKKSGVWVEITNLVITGHNDDPRMISAMCEWVKQNVGADVPVHFSRFFPMYKLTGIQPTPLPSLERARECGLKAGLQFVYIGNAPGNPGENTYCPKCRKVLVRRSGYNILDLHIRSGKCRYCGEKIGGLWTA